MRSQNILVYFLALFIAVISLIPLSVSGQSGVQSRIVAAIDNTKLTTLHGNVHPMARSEFDRGPAPASLALDHMLLVLQRSAVQENALETLLAEQQNPSSPNYHKWLTPDQFGQQFGPSAQDIQKITSWLQSQGFQVNQVAKGGTAIDFSGTAGQVQQAFHTTMHSYVLANGEQHWANSTDPQIPAALTPVVAGINSLNNFARRRMSHNLGVFQRSKDGKVTRISPQFTFAGGCNSSNNECYTLAPADFAKIYNVPSSVTGTGQTIAIVSDSDVNALDVTTFRTLFGLPAINYQQIEATTVDPGIQSCANNGNECEAVLDVEWAGAVATGAKIDLVVSPTTATTFGGDTSAMYIINNNLASVLGYSYGACELELGTSGNAFYQNLWSEAAGLGITVVVSTGDNGSAGCESPNSSDTLQAQPATTGLAVNGVGSTPFNVAVGGTDFNDVFNPTTYWSNSNSTGQLSAISYIPEIAYNDSCSNPLFAGTGFVGFDGLTSNPESNCNDLALINFQGQGVNLITSFGGGGGASNCTTNSTTATTVGPVSSCSGGYAKPSWQVGPGVPGDGKRDLPDVSLFAGDGTLQNFYVVCEADADLDGSNRMCNLNAPFQEFEGVGGTSVSAQAFGGIVALIDQQTGTRQGNLNAALYPIAAAQSASACNASGPPASTCVFYDTTFGSNAMPCASGSPNCTVSNSGDTIGLLAGYSAGAGFDLATGLGSVNVGNLLNAFPNFSLSSSVTSFTISSASTPATGTVTVTSQNGFAGTVSLACSGLPSGASCTFTPSSVTLAANGTATSGVSIASTAALLNPSFQWNRPGTVGLAAAVTLAMLALLTVSFTRRPNIGFALVALAALLSMAACAGSSSTSSTGSSTGSGSTGSSSTTASITGTTAANGASPGASHGVSITVTVQ